MRVENTCINGTYNLFVAVRMVSQGHRMVQAGWALFEEGCSEAGPGELPQLLRSLEMSTTPPSTPVKSLFEEVEKKMAPPPQPGAPSPSPTQGISDEPVIVKVEGKEGGKVMYKYGCPMCTIPIMRSKRGMDAHIRQFHTFKPYLCSYCDFTTYNLDSLNRHEKKQHD